MNELAILNDKLDTLLRLYVSQKKEITKLKEQLENAQQHHVQLKQQLQEAEQNMLAMNLNKHLLNQEEKEKMRGQLDQVMREIDKILVSLHD
ncbi:MAG: hypothetical protein JST52_00690 [Bacteroidetes bacterium]|nr:hypothetical protein [Bacteroidota bacterium]MBS1740317.1 hypothetical protein [Bacteroidota bacterium]